MDKDGILTPAEMEVSSLFYQGFRAKEIASNTGRAIQTVYKLHYRAKRRLEKMGLSMPIKPRMHEPGARKRGWGQRILDAA